VSNRAIACKVSCMLCGDAYADGIAIASGDPGNQPWLFRACNSCVDEMTDARAEDRKITAITKRSESSSSYYGPDWQMVRATILARDGNACRDEGHIAAGGSTPRDRLVVHHIKPLKEFGGDYNAANVFDNLITLCTLCHGRWHARLNQEAKAAQA
jgi:5-methylcytosine-specific restriction endonuclease McrA